MCKTICVVNQKGGVGKTCTAINLGAAMAMQGARVLLVDVDSQGSLTAALGNPEPDSLPVTLADLLGKCINDEALLEKEGILHHEEGFDYLPGNIELAGLEVTLVNVLSRETILRDYLTRIKPLYDYILLDCTPSLGMLTINALAAADRVIIPVQAAYLPVKGLVQLFKTIGKIKRQINRKLVIDGVLLTMVDTRNNYTKEIIELVEQAYGNNIRIYKSRIPFSVRAAECPALGISIFRHDPKGKVAAAYQHLCEEVLG